MKYLKIIILIGIVICVSVILFVYSSKRYIHSAPMSAISILGDIYQHVDPVLGSSEKSSTKSMWVTTDGHLVAVTNQGSVTGYLKGSGNDTKALSAVDAINTYATKILESVGFKPDQMNSATSTESGPFFMVRHAFVSNDGTYRCVITPPVEIYAWGIDCINTKDLDAAYEAEQPFLNLFENAKDIALIPTVQGNFALINATDGSAGYYAILKKDKGTWKIIFRGQQRPACTLMQENSVPQSIYQKCE